MILDRWLVRLVVALLATAILSPIALLASSAAATPAASPSPSSIAGYWEGEIETQNPKTKIKVRFWQEHGNWEGTIHMSPPGFEKSLRDIKIDGEKVSFVIAKVMREPRFDGKLADGKISGTYNHGGAKYDFHLNRKAVETKARPQDSKPPSRKAAPAPVAPPPARRGGDSR